MAAKKKTVRTVRWFKSPSKHGEAYGTRCGDWTVWVHPVVQHDADLFEIEMWSPGSPTKLTASYVRGLGKAKALGLMLASFAEGRCS